MPSETTSVTGVSTEPSDVVSGEMPEGSSSREVMAKRGSTALGSWLVAIDLDGTTVDEAGDASRGGLNFAASSGLVTTCSSRPVGRRQRRCPYSIGSGLGRSTSCARMVP